MKLKNKNNSLPRAAQNYIESLISNGKIFTEDTIMKHFPKLTVKQITEAVARLIKGKNYVTVSNKTTYIPSKSLATANAPSTATKSSKIVITSRQSTNGRIKVTNIPLSTNIVKQLNLSAREYRYSINGNNLTIYRNSNNNKHSKFVVWKSNRACIPTSDVGKQYTVVVK